MATALLQTDGGEGGIQMLWVPRGGSTKTNGWGSVYLQYSNKPKINHPKVPLGVLALRNTSRKASGAIPEDTHRTDSLVPVRLELGPWLLPHWAQPQVPAALRLPTYTKLSGSSFPIASTRAAGRVEEDPSNTSHHTCRHKRKQCHHMSLASFRKPAQNPPLTFSLLPARPRLLRCWCNMKHSAGKQRRYWLTFFAGLRWLC